MKKDWSPGEDYPKWMNELSLAMISGGYLLEDETPNQAFKRVSKTIANRLEQEHLEELFYEAITKNWLCLASPVLSNTGTDRGLPISCFGIDTPDSIMGIGLTNAELMRLTSYGGGVGIGLNRVRGRGEVIKNKGISEGVVPWAKIYDSTIVATNQGAVRRGAASVNLDVYHKDIDEFLEIRRPKGDVNRQCLNIHQCVTIPDTFMYRLLEGQTREKELWSKILKTRMETGEPYIMYTGNINKVNPIAYKKNNLDVTMTNICSEIALHTDEEHSFVCCLSSLNLARYDEWKDYRFKNGMSLPELAIWFLDGVLEEFIVKSENKLSMERSVRSAKKGRALGLGVLGWHTYLQMNNLPFVSIGSTAHTHSIFNFIKKEAEKASRDLAVEYGEPMWCKGTGMRNTHLLAIAPTVSNSVISGAVSAGIEPRPYNVFTQKTAKGSYFVKNKQLEELLEKKGYNKKEVWDQILKDDGSVLNLPSEILTDEEKEVFLTFGEINQLGLVHQAAVRQIYIDQAQSLNLMFSHDDEPKWISKVHKEAFKLGIKTLYYMRSQSVLKGDIGSRIEDCVYCES